MFGLKRKIPEFIRSEYLRKQLQVIEGADNPVVRNDAVIRLASHLGDLSVLGNRRTTDLVSGEGRCSLSGLWPSLSEAEVLEVVSQVRGLLGCPFPYNKKELQPLLSSVKTKVFGNPYCQD